MEQKYELKFEMLGWESDCKKEIRILNRVIGWTSDGIEYKSDQRHADTIVREFGLEDCKTVSAPGTNEAKNTFEESRGEVLTEESATKFRSIAARLNFLALDRAGLGATRVVQKSPWSKRDDYINSFADSDWAGDRKGKSLHVVAS